VNESGSTADTPSGTKTVGVDWVGMSELVTFGETPVEFTPPGHRRLATTPETSVHVDGTESSAAVAATVLGGACTWVSKLPDSPLGRRVAGQLRRHGVDTEVAWADPDETRQGLVFRESGQPPRADGVWHDREGTAAATASPGDLPMDLVQEANAVFTGVSTPALSEQAATTTEAMLRAAHGSDATTAADLDYQPGLGSPERYRETLTDLLGHLDVLVANEDDAARVFEWSGQPRELAHTIAANYDLEVVVITRSQGAVALEDTPGTNVVHEREGIETDAVDATGQHAAFDGGFLQRFVVAGDVADALGYGVAAATLSRTEPGPLLTADRGEIERLVDRLGDSAR
jgi:2-dehydro-3-deoxygluconokinase